MPTVYSNGSADMYAAVAARLKAAEPELAAAGVKVGVLLASNPDGPAVKHGGYPCSATIRVVSARDRVAKGYDAELTIDDTVWAELSPTGREALVAHELRHLRLVPAKVKKGQEPDPDAPAWQVDDLGRPKLKAVPADWNAGDGFAEIVAEFGESAVELASLRAVVARAEGAVQQGRNDHGVFA